MSAIIPILANPETRKATFKSGKILLIFGVLGAAVIAFIVLSKKFKPFKIVGDFFMGAVKGVVGFFGGIGSGLANIISGFKPKGAIEYVVKQPRLTDREVKKQLIDKYYAKENESTRREFRRYAKQVRRTLEVLKQSEGIPTAMAGRISLVQSAFRQVDKIFVKDIPKQFETIWNRKRDFLKGNLEADLKAIDMLKVIKDPALIGYGKKMALRMMQQGRGAM